MTNYIFPSLPLILVLHLLFRNYRLKKQLKKAKVDAALSEEYLENFVRTHTKRENTPKAQMDDLISDFERVITKNPITQEESAALSTTLSDRPKVEPEAHRFSSIVSEPPPPELVNLPKQKRRSKQFEAARNDLKKAAQEGKVLVVRSKKNA